MTRLHYLAAQPPPATSPPVSGYVGWWDASDTSSITTSSGLVTQWNDKSGNSRHLTGSGGASAQPVTSTNTLNGLNTITFNSTGDKLTVTSTFTVGTIYFAVYIASGSGAANMVTGDGSQKQFLSMGAGGNGCYTYDGSIKGNVSIPTATAYVWTMLANGGAGSLIAKNGVDGTTFSTTIGAVTQLRVGTGPDNAWAMDVGELIVYTDKHGATDRNAVENYLGTKWGVTIS